MLANKWRNPWIEEGDSMYLNALDNEATVFQIQRWYHFFYMYLPDNVPLDVKFILESNSSRTSSEARHKLKILWCQIVIYPNSKGKVVEPNKAKQTPNEAI